MAIAFDYVEEADEAYSFDYSVINLEILPTKNAIQSNMSSSLICDILMKFNGYYHERELLALPMKE
jgi:hypothetical protein